MSLFATLSLANQSRPACCLGFDERVKLLWSSPSTSLPRLVIALAIPGSLSTTLIEHAIRSPARSDAGQARAITYDMTHLRRPWQDLKSLKKLQALVPFAMPLSELSAAPFPEVAGSLWSVLVPPAGRLGTEQHPHATNLSVVLYVSQLITNYHYQLNTEVHDG